LTTEEQSRWNAGMRRGDEIRAEIASIVARKSSWQQGKRLLKLSREIDQLARSLEDIAPLLLAVEFANIRRKMESDWEKVMTAWKPTHQQSEMISLTERLKSKEGPSTPDFEKLYSERAELDRRITDRNE
jgi:urease accessory protein UreF